MNDFMTLEPQPIQAENPVPDIYVGVFNLGKSQWLPLTYYPDAPAVMVDHGEHPGRPAIPTMEFGERNLSQLTEICEAVATARDMEWRLIKFKATEEFDTKAFLPFGTLGYNPPIQ